MQYKLAFEIAACLLLVVVLLHIYLVRQFPTCKARVFLAFIFVSIIERFFYIVSVIGVANAQFVPQVVNELLAFAFFVTETVLLLYFLMKNPGEWVDVITGVGNGNTLKWALTQKLKKKKELATYSIEIKNLHQMQIIFGEENSEILLKEIGKYLLDLSGKFHVFHRRNESFDIVLEKEADKENLLGILCERFGDVWNIQGNCILVDTIITHQHYPNHFKDLPEFYGMQEYMLEQAIEQNLQVIENNSTLINQYHRRKQVERALNRAVRERSFDVYFQPIYSLKEKRIVSLEALTYMNDEQFGFIFQDEFIPIAEKNGSMLAIGEIVLENCCRFLAKHILSNDSLGIRTIHVNLSKAQCVQQNLKETIWSVLEKYHIPPAMITLEVTENMAILAPEQMFRHMKELRKFGIEFAAEGYGTGNSNLASLIKFPFREIKIDGDMVGAYFENETVRIILENEIQTMKRLGLPVVVQGIETKEQSDAMEVLGVNYVQGDYYGKPMPEKECLVYIRKFYDER